MYSTKFEFRGGEKIEETVSNITNEIMVVGSIYSNPDLIVEYSQYIKSKYDFFDEATRFFYECAVTIFETRSQALNKTVVVTFMSENQERLAQYKLLRGWKTIADWMQLAVIDDFKNYFEVLKKYSLLREYQRNGFNIEKIMSHKLFEKFTASDIYRMIRSKADRINTVILTNDSAEILNSNIKDTLHHCMEAPDMGLPIPFPIMNDVFRGLKKKSVMAVGMLSNAGKSRYMAKLIAYITLVRKEKVLVMLNEMTVEEMRYALITTVINNPEFQQLHGINLNKQEREITLGLYKDKNGEFIYPEKDDWGDVTEPIEHYIERVSKLSSEYNDIMHIAEWIEDQTQGLIFTKDVSMAYDDKTLEFEIRKASMTQGIEYVFYDTMKNDIATVGDWAAMMVSVTKITEICKQLNMFGYLSIQLTDDANYIEPDELVSNQIANCKGLKRVLHTLLLCKEIPPNKFSKYGYVASETDWGEPARHDLNPNKRYYAFNVDKNRFGTKPHLLFEVDLNLNTWIEVGELVRK